MPSYPPVSCATPPTSPVQEAGKSTAKTPDEANDVASTAEETSPTQEVDSTSTGGRGE